MGKRKDGEGKEGMGKGGGKRRWIGVVKAGDNMSNV